MYVDDYSAFGGARKAVDRWLKKRGWTEHARKAHAIMRAVPRPRLGCAEDRLGSFAVWKATPYSEDSPFEVVPLGAQCGRGTKSML